ncbi:MAG: hypothetical protein J7L15_03145 [Clostridiales bacterium]|nr:hypothetical protein [Clostridiales bacterium]
MVKKQNRIKSTKFTDDFVVGDFWMSEMGPTKITNIYNGSIDGWVKNENKIRIYDLAGVVGPWSKGENNLLYKMTKENHPEYFL